jgi:hypothetical protein
MNNGALLFPATTKDLKLVNRPNVMEHVWIKFDYMHHNFNKYKKEHPDISAEDPESIEDVLGDGVEKGQAKLSLN